MAVSLSIAITENSQSVANNTSNVTVKVNIAWTNGSWNHLSPSGWVKIDGTQYNFTNTFNDSKTSTGSKTLYSKTVDVTHGSDGTKTLSCSASFDSGVSSDVITATASKKLTTIPRKSSLTVSDGTLGTEQTLTITEKADSFAHRLYYKCGSSSDTYILGSSSTTSSSLSVKWTPPHSLAQYNTTGKSVSVTFTLATYSGSTLVGSNTYTKTFSIPNVSSMQPGVAISPTDAAGYAGTYGGYIQGVSKLKVTLNTTPKYNSPIKTYKTVADGSTYTSSSFTTGVISSDSDITVTATVTDARGYSGTATRTLPVLAYSAPKITKFSAQRCDSDGTVNDKGKYAKITIRYSITSLDGQNAIKRAVFEHKKSSASSYTSVGLGTTVPTADIVKIISADSGSSYNIVLTVEDNFKTTKATITLSTGFTLMHFKANGRGMAIGKVSEANDTLDVGLKMRSSYGHIITSPVELKGSFDLDTLLDPGYYIIGDTTTSQTIINKPSYLMDGDNATAFIEVFAAGNGYQKFQRYYICSKDNPTIGQRVYYQNEWSGWVMVAGRTSWRSLTLDSNFASYGSGNTNNPRYRANANVVTVDGVVTPRATITSSTTKVPIATGIHESFRPTREVVVVCQGSGINRWACSIGTDGVVYAHRYGTNDYVDIPAGAWLPFTITYSV